MCGIAGIVSNKDESQLIGKMLQVTAHRGPDGQGVSYADHNQVSVTLGHRRLSIIDLSTAGSQPMWDGSGRFCITFNGEIYNYLEIRQELKRLGTVFRSDSDTEVVLEAYKAWGTGCLSHFNGMFAFALHDIDSNRLFCARDRYGEKPFLYSSGDGFFAFASEYKSILLHPEVSLDYDDWRLMLAAYNASTGLDKDPQTVFRDVKQLLPSEAMLVNLTDLSIDCWKYWSISPPSELSKVSDQEAFERFGQLLTDSVRLRLRSDVPVGSCLSGGLDSSAIVCIVRKLLGNEATYNTFTGSFPGTSADESHFAKLVIEQAGTVSHVTEPTAGRFVDDLPAFIWHNELPVGSSSQFAQWCVFDLAKQNGVTVLLDGQGADELLGGYEQYFAKYVMALEQTGDTSRLQYELPKIRGRYPLALTPPVRAIRDRLPFAMRHYLSNHFGIGTSMLYGLNLETARRINRETELPKIPGFNALSNSLVQDSFGRYLNTLLRYGDRNSMAHSREVRLPFCDHRIAEFVFTLPPHLFMGEVQTKRLLRESMKGILPEPIRTRWNKQGFRPPQDLWFQNKHFLRCVKDGLSDRDFRESPYWIPKWWDKALQRVESGELGLGWNIWHPFIIGQWQRHFIGPIKAMKSMA